MNAGKVGDDDTTSEDDTPLTDDPTSLSSVIAPLDDTDTDTDPGIGADVATEADNNDATPSTISLEKIFLAIGTHVPDISTLNVYETMERSFHGRDFVFNIIGQSHYIYSKDGAFHELCSCVPLDHPDEQDTATVDLTLGNERTFGLADDETRYRTTVTVLPLDDFPRREYDLAHRFAPGAYTAIDLTPPFFETHHTYPERGLVVRTRSKLSL